MAIQSASPFAAIEPRLRLLLPADLYALAWIDPTPVTLNRVFEHLRTLQHILYGYGPRQVVETLPRPGECRHKWQDSAHMFTDLAGFTRLVEANAGQGRDDQVRAYRNRPGCSFVVDAGWRARGALPDRRHRDAVPDGRAVQQTKHAEGAGQVGRVCLTETSYEQVEDQFHFESWTSGYVLVADDMSPDQLAEYDITSSLRRLASPVLMDRSVERVEPLANYQPAPIPNVLVESAARRQIRPNFVQPTVMFVNLIGLPEAVDRAAPGEEANLVSSFSRIFSLINEAVVVHGPTFAAEIGEPRGRREFNVQGDTVNTAARLMGRAATNQILTTEPVHREVEAHFDCDVLEPVSLKGKAALTPIFALNNPLD